MTGGYVWIWSSEYNVLGHNPNAPEPWVLWARDRDGDPCNGIYGQSCQEVMKHWRRS